MIRTLKSRSLVAVLAVLALVWCPAHAEPLFEAEEDEGIRAELKEQQRHADTMFSDRVREFLSTEMPDAMGLLERAREAADAPDATIDQKFELCEVKFRLTDLAHELHEAKNFRPEVYPKLKRFNELDIQAHTIAREIHEAGEEGEHDELMDELEEVLEEGFELSQELREFELGQMEEEIGQVRSVLEKREDNRDVIIDRRIHQLVYHNDPYEW